MSPLNRNSSINAGSIPIVIIESIKPFVFGICETLVIDWLSDDILPIKDATIFSISEDKITNDKENIKIYKIINISKFFRLSSLLNVFLYLFLIINAAIKNINSPMKIYKTFNKFEDAISLDISLAGVFGFNIV